MTNYIPVEKRCRVVSIIQLCLVFSYLLWIGGYPFTGELYEIKSQKLVYESVMNNSEFNFIPLSDQKSVNRGYKQLQKRQATSFFSKLEESAKITLLYTPPLIRVWILFSLLIPIFLLFNIEGAVAVSWLIPIVVLLAMGDGKTELTEEMRLFPTEQTLISQYIDEPLSKNISTQHEQLKRGWNNYLIEEWSDESMDNRLIHGELSFNLARIDAIERDGFPTPKEIFSRKPSPLATFVNFCWSLFFALAVTFRRPYSFFSYKPLEQASDD